MSRLIDADALMRDIENYHLSDGMFQHWVEVQPTVDAVPVIRCKDCKHNKNNKWVDCHITEFFGRTLDNYCSMAERKGEDATDKR